MKVIIRGDKGMFQLRKWTSFPYVTYAAGITLVAMYIYWFIGHSIIIGGTPVESGVCERALSTVFHCIFPLRYETDIFLLTFRFLEVFGGFVLAGIIEVALARYWTRTHSPRK